jgi:ABC-type lipoprotein export system ATPase subunit
LRDQKEQVCRTIQKLDLEKDILYKDFNKISGGQKQRIIISICLSLNKSIVLIDEPTAALDDVSINTLINLLGSLNKKTIVSATHNKLLMNSANRIINL